MKFKSFNKIIVAANPSFLTKTEESFWIRFDRICKREGWRLFKHSMRRISEDERTMILPARLSDVSKSLQNLPAGVSEAMLPAWFQKDNFDMIIDWEVQRWQLAGCDPSLVRGLTQLAWHVDHLFQKLRPAGTIVSNKIDHGTSLFYWAAQHYGSQQVFFERSPLETFIVEDCGMFAESEIWEKYSAEVADGMLRYLKVGRSCSAYLARNTDGFRKQQFDNASHAQSTLAAISGSKLFLPMDNILWTGWAQKDHWQGRIDYYPDTPTPVEAINLLARIAAKQGSTLIVKKHPSDVQDYPITASNVIFLDAPLELLIAHTDVTICFLTKVAFVSGSIGKPTVTLAPNTAAASEATFHAKSVTDWEAMIGAALTASRAELAQRKDKLENLLGWLDRRFYVDNTLPSDFDKPGPEQLLSRICASSAGKLAGGSITSLDHIISAEISAFKNKKTWLCERTKKQTRIILLFDVSRLANTRVRYSGISRFSRTLLNLLSRMPTVELIGVLFKPDVLKQSSFANDIAAFARDLGVEELLLPDQLSVRLEGRAAVYFSPYDELQKIPNIDVPRIVTVHDVLHITYSEYYLDPKIRFHIDKVIRSISSQDMVITVSEFTRMQLMQVMPISPDQVETVHLAADDVFKMKSEEEIASFRKRMNLGDNPYFVLFGQFEFRKNVPTTLSAIRNAIQSGASKAKFLVISSAIGSDRMQAAVAASGIPEDRVVFLPGPEDEEIATAYSGAHGLLYVSLAEGFGLPVIEGMSCGCPVITSAVTSLPEVAGDGVLYVDPYSVQQIADAILALEGSDSLRAHLRARALARSASFSWERTAEGVMRVVHEALSRSPSSKPEVSSPIRMTVNDTNYNGIDLVRTDHAAQLLTSVAVRLLVDPAKTIETLLAYNSAEVMRIEAALNVLPSDSPVVIHFIKVRNWAIAEVGYERP